MPRDPLQKQLARTVAVGDLHPSDEIYQDRTLIGGKTQRRIFQNDEQRTDSSRAHWLGAALFLLLLAFWILDSLKDPVFGELVGGSLEQHQPPAKVLSVCATLALVCLLEYMSAAQANDNNFSNENEQIQSDKVVLDPGGDWSTMSLQTVGDDELIGGTYATSDAVNSSIFPAICLPYCLVFGLFAYLLQFNFAVATTTSKQSEALQREPQYTFWVVLGYFWFAAVESFGSIAIATYWSFVNSTLSLDDAERYYGLIIAIAQLGAISGSTMVTTGVWSTITLMVLSTLIILLHVLVMITYCRRFAPSAHHHQEVVAPVAGHRGIVEQEGQTLWSGVYLILRHNYVLLILGVSCLYEVSLTCLNYQMTLLGWKRFEETEHERMSFQQFMGHYGQMVNVSSLILSSLVFPFLIQRVGLRLTLRLFPTLLIVANILAFGILPRNLTVLFFSLSLLKAMTYSIHDPSKEILYLPTSNAIKFKSKFWIDVVGARIAKAIGSSINRYAGSVDRSIRVASTPSFLTAGALLYVCYKVGIQFEVLVATKRIVGVNDNPDSAASTYAQIDGQVHMVDSPESDDDVFEDELLAPTGSSETGLALTRLG